jgi:hypothetical protein
VYRADHAGCPAPGAIISRPTEPRWNLNPDCRGERRKKENGKRTWRDFELRGQLDRLAILEMEDEYRWKRFNEYRDLRAHFAGARAGWTDLYKSWARDVRECVLNGMY